MKKFSLTISFLIFLSILLTSCEVKENSNSEKQVSPTVKKTTKPTVEKFSYKDKWDKTKTEKPLKISEIRTQKIADGNYETEGYVVDKVFPCNCPPGMKCKCDPPSVTISEKNNVSIKNQLKDYEIKIGVNPPKELISGEKYRFKVKVKFEEYDLSKKDEVGLLAFK